MPQTPSVIVFDVNETLLDITVLEPLFARLFSDASVMRQWFAELILQSEALTLSGLYVRFDELTAGVLRMVGDVRRVSVQRSDVEELGTLLRTMPAHPDAAPALAMLKQSGFRLVTLTNSPPPAAPSPLERAGLASFFDRTYSVDQVRRFKPAPETYRMVAEGEGVLPADLCLVACHVWDTVGAQAAGCVTGLVERSGNAALRAEGVPFPDIVAADLQTLATELVHRWGRSALDR
ncbi:haloacid dehalogenase type II [Aureimonas jatrophae]|uniref:(S)-2-haloacid dehalogenase n=1 Tax=Aureimonas jatrophae TaxID=1166073 RepID=A0A1H0MNQ2_9HYPH|nr:haloacid dehalogenase type II [Aureimonas jatrophae]MBB3952874.1 2-haloacid dehalogenase [Aureimonas jatrophae]SDO81925.1 2-haloacid dehalogenase [Aureimonas jatrophae]